MVALTSRQAVELFHLLFVRALFGGLPDKRVLAIKGGINLRLFFDSVRYSEDLDLDVAKIAKETLENRVDRLLASPALNAPLKSRGIVIAEVSKPKQTETVQRWKVALDQGGVQDRTKIEFSRRPTSDTAASEAVSSAIANAYSVPAFLATHYRCADAVKQKIEALAFREESQPRDVFDLHVLFARHDAPSKLPDVDIEVLDKAARNAEDISYDRYVALVLAYLDPEQAGVYEGEEAWHQMQLDVIERIAALK